MHSVDGESHSALRQSAEDELNRCKHTESSLGPLKGLILEKKNMKHRNGSKIDQKMLKYFYLARSKTKVHGVNTK
jgi:hypothetical protein